MDLLTAHRLVMVTGDGLKKCVLDFSGVKEAADLIVKWDNCEVLDKEEMEVEKRQKKEKSKPGELPEDEPLKAVERNFEVNAIVS
ncbi:Hypothetical protein FKW44_022175 [Caligus rogercresseyi]|uniref:Uncharacterized protein n=1 Tax=Caligus rogercresseyi TaxID=217165 RepID=A0A7T8GSB9_CALRO|nr:Hypothetical protein FKW44_022175 [Caligus rogercresseyi]